MWNRTRFFYTEKTGGYYHFRASGGPILLWFRDPGALGAPFSHDTMCTWTTLMQLQFKDSRMHSIMDWQSSRMSLIRRVWYPLQWKVCTAVSVWIVSLEHNHEGCMECIDTPEGGAQEQVQYIKFSYIPSEACSNWLAAISNRQECS